MAFYITNPTGTEMQNGRRFETLEAATAGAKTTMRRSIAKSEHGTSSFYVMEEIPGRHQTRAVVNPDMSVSAR